MKPTRMLLIDTDTLVYAAASRCETNTDWGDGVWSLTANLDEAKAFFTSDLKRILREAQAQDFVLAISDYYNDRWREGLMPSYKKNRVARRPLVYDALRQWLEKHPNAKTKEHLEGDDILGILMTDDRFAPGVEKVCVAIDKDMQQIPGLHLNYQNARDTGVWTPVRIHLKDADRFFMYQTLTGDSVDGYKGCPNVGPKRAEKILEGGSSLSDWWPLIVSAYESKGLSESDAIQQAQVARILRREDYDFENRRVIPWQPK